MLWFNFVILNDVILLIFLFLNFDINVEKLIIFEILRRYLFIFSLLGGF